MNGYSLVIDMSSDKESTRHSTPIKTLPLNLVRTLKISDSSTEVYRGSEAELNSTFETKCSPKRVKLTPRKRKAARVTFNLPPAVCKQKNTLESNSDDFYEELDSPEKASPLKTSQRANVYPTQGEKKTSNSLNDLNEPKKKTPQEYHEKLCSPEAQEYFEKMVHELEQEEKTIAYMTAERGRGPHQIRDYISRPPVVIKKVIPHCHGLPVYLASRGALSRPAPG